MNIKCGVKTNQKKCINLVLFFFIILNLSLILEGKKHPICVSKTIEGIHFKFCIDKTKIKKNSTFYIKVTVKIPKDREIYVAIKDIRICNYPLSDELVFCLGHTQIYGDRVPKFYDLRQFSKKGVYRNKKSYKIKDMKKSMGLRFNSTISLEFSVSFCTKICDSIKDRLLQSDWSHWAYRHEDWYEECYMSIFRNYIFNEKVGNVTLQIIE